eukprot:1150155-Pelagomonas_calceolata.AAC.2
MLQSIFAYVSTHLDERQVPCIGTATIIPAGCEAHTIVSAQSNRGAPLTLQTGLPCQRFCRANLPCQSSHDIHQSILVHGFHHDFDQSSRVQPDEDEQPHTISP